VVKIFFYFSKIDIEFKYQTLSTSLPHIVASGYCSSTLNEDNDLKIASASRVIPLFSNVACKWRSHSARGAPKRFQGLTLF